MPPFEKSAVCFRQAHDFRVLLMNPPSDFGCSPWCRGPVDVPIDDYHDFPPQSATEYTDALCSRPGEPSISTTAVNPLRYARRLKAAGVPEHQAEEMADALGNELVEQIATKDDLKDSPVSSP